MTNSTATVIDQTDASVEAPVQADEQLETTLERVTRELEEAKAKLAAATTTPAKPGNSLIAANAAEVKSWMDDFKAAGYTRPELTSFTLFNDSTVWRAQNERVHTSEVGTWRDLHAKFKAGELTAPKAAGRKPKVEALQAQLATIEALYEAKIKAVTDVLASEAKTTAQYKRIIEAAQAALA